MANFYLLKYGKRTVPTRIIRIRRIRPIYGDHVDNYSRKREEGVVPYYKHRVINDDDDDDRFYAILVRTMSSSKGRREE